MKEVLNIRVDKEILEQIKNFQLLVGLQSGFVPSKTSVIEKLIVLGLEDLTEDYEVWRRTPNEIEDDDMAEITQAASQIYNFTQVWLDKSNSDIEE